MQSVSTISPPEPNIRRCTRDEYYQMAEFGWFQNQRVELIDGRVFEMNAQRHPHAAAVTLVGDVLRSVFGPGFWIRSQLPLSLPGASEPEPDGAVVRGTPRDYTDHPTTALLVVEVSDTTLAFDRREKTSLYASAGIPDYWIVNLVDRQLEVYRGPVADSSQPSGFRYGDTHIVKLTESVSPLAAEHSKIEVSELFP